MRKDAPLSVEVPTPDRDSPAWVKVGVIAAVGFVIGIAWPRVMGVKLGPNAPGEAAAAAAGGPPQVNVLRGNVIACKTSEGESKKGKDCGTITGLDNVIAPHLKKL